MEAVESKLIPLNDKHIELGAKMVPFAGYSMPVQYSGVIEEHNTVRSGVGIFDVSHMGEFMVRGEKSLDFLQSITTNDVSKLFPGKAQYSCFPNNEGGIVDDLLIYMMKENEYLLVVNGACLDKDWDWVNSHNSFGVELENISDDIALFAVQGPKASEALQPLTSVNLSEMKYYTFEKGDFAGKQDVIISATGYTGSGGFEIYVNKKDALDVFDAIMKSGESQNIQPIGLAARDTLRLEMGFCLYGNDINDSTSPIEAGLGWITKFTKEFTNSEFHKNLKENGVSKKLVAFEMIDRGIPRGHYEICDAAENVIGEVTSGTQSPSLGKGIGLGYVAKDLSSIDSEIYIKVRKKYLKAQVVKLPFYKG